MSATTYAIRQLRQIDRINESEKQEVNENVIRVINRTQGGVASIPVADSFTELRGVLEGATDEEGQSGTEMLLEERERDKRKDSKSTRHSKSDE